MEIFFLIFLFLSAYSYLIYPCILLLLSIIKQNPWAKENILPIISIIVSVHNEQGVIQKKIRNTLELKYPEDSLEIIISSDGSTDRTDQIVSEINDPHVALLSFERLGKTACLNKVVPAAKGDIIVFTDANSMFPSDLLSKLTRNFADIDVGLVTGWTKYRSQEGEEDSTGIYARLEKWTKDRESMISSCIGADGAVFAIRKNLYRSLDDRDINDFQIPLNIRHSSGCQYSLEDESDG